MASDYQEWIARDVKREAPKELTKKEKRANWWHYHWLHVALGVALVLVVGGVVLSAVRNRNNQPDCQIAYIGAAFLPDETVAALEAQLAPLVGDVDGNGKTIVQIRQYAVDLEDENANPYQQMTLVTHLSANDNFLYLLEDPKGFQEQFGLLTYGDSTRPEEGTEVAEPLWYAWKDCKTLAELPLGEYQTGISDGEPVTGSSQELLSGLYIGRALCNDWSQEEAAAYTQIWQNLIAGAQ